MSENAILIFIYLLFMTSSVSLGSVISHFSKLEYDNYIEDFFFRFVFGCIFFSYLFQFLGAVHLLYSPLLLAFYLIPLIYPLYSIIKNGRSLFSKIHVPRENIIYLLLLLFILFPAIPYLFLLPYSWDPIAYHLMLPKVYLADHLFRFYKDFPQVGYPIGIESLYAFGELFKEPRFANLLNFTFLTSAATYIIFGLKKIFSPKILLLAAVLYLFRNSLYTEVAMNPFIDYGFSFFGLSLGIALYKFVSSKQTRWLIVLITLALFCPLIKFNGFIILFAILITTIIFVIKNHPPINWKKIIIITFIAALPLTYWLTKNTITMHDPLYPFMTNIFKSVDYDPESYVSIFDSIKKDYWHINKVVSNFSISTDNADDYASIGDVIYYLMLLTSSVASLFIFKGTIRYLSFFAVLSLLPIGMLVSPVFRYYLPIVPIASIISASLFTTILNNWRWRYLPFILIFIVSLFIQIDNAFTQRQIIFTNIPKQKILDYFNYKNTKSYFYLNDNAQMIEYINKNLDSEKDKVLFIFDNRLYYFQIPVVFEYPTKLGHFTNPLIKTADEVQESLKNEGINYVLVSTNWGLYPNLKTDLFQSFVAKKLKTVHSNGGLTLYKLNVL